MASFVPNHRKKKEHLRDKENNLRRLIECGASNEELLQAATEVRDARVRVIRVKQAIGPQSLVNRTEHQRIKQQIAAAEAVRAEAILGEFLQEKKSLKSE